MFSRQLVFSSLTFLAAALTGSAALAGPFMPQGSFVAPAPSDRIPLPPQVPGKEYSNGSPLGDRRAHPKQGVPDFGQVVYWYGNPLPPPNGGTTDTTDFFFGDANVCPIRLSCQVDALANRADVLFVEVIANEAALLFSTEGDNPAF